MDDIVDEKLENRQQMLSLLGTFVSLALLLAGMGIYGVLPHLVAETRREIRPSEHAQEPRVRRVWSERRRGPVGAWPSEAITRWTLCDRGLRNCRFSRLRLWGSCWLVLNSTRRE
jgi:hypothetical protein